MTNTMVNIPKVVKLHASHISREGTRGHRFKLCQEGSKLNLRRQSFPVRITKVWNELPDSVMNAPNVNTFKNRFDRHWRGEYFLYNYEAPVPGHHLTEDRFDRHWRGEYFLYNYEAPVPGHHLAEDGLTDTGEENRTSTREEDYNYEAHVPGNILAEDRAKRFEHVDLTIEANAYGHEGS